MNAQQKYRLKYVCKILIFIPLSGLCFVSLPIYWIITGRASLDWLMEDFMKYKEPKKQRPPAIVGEGNQREVRTTQSWQGINHRIEIRTLPPKPIVPKQETDQTDKYEY